MAERRFLQRIGAVGGRSLAILVALVLLILAAERMAWEWDWSADQRFSLQPGLAAILADLDEPVTVTGLWPRTGLDGGTRHFLDTVSERLRVIAGHSDHLSIRILDPELDLPEVEAFAEQHGEALPGSLYLTRAERRPFRIPLSYRLQHSLQRSLGGGLAALQSATRLPIHVVQGHGELDLDGGSDGLRVLAERLRFAAYAVEPLDAATLDRLGRIPAEHLLLVPGPTAPLGERLCQAIDDFLQAGGRACFLVDDRCPTDLRDVLRDYGVLLSPNGVVQAQDHIRTGADRRLYRLVIDRRFGLQPTPLTEALIADGLQLVSPRTNRIRYLVAADPAERERLADQGVRVPQPPPAPNDHLVVPHGPTWEAPAADRQPREVPEEAIGEPLILATDLRYAAIAAPVGPHIAIWGSREAAADRWLDATAFRNERLLLGLVDHLADREASVPIDRQQLAVYQVDAEDGTLFWLIGLLVALLPSCCIGIAVLTWWERR